MNNNRYAVLQARKWAMLVKLDAVKRDLADLRSLPCGSMTPTCASIAGVLRAAIKLRQV